MKALIKRYCLILIIGTLLMTLWAARLTFSSQRSFSLGDDPSFIALGVEFSGGLSGTTVSYSLDAEGSLVIEFSAAGPDRKILRTLSTSLTRDEMSALLDPLVESGFIETRRSELYKEMEASRGGIPHTTDASDMCTALHLSRYKGPGRLIPTSAHNRLCVHSPEALAKKFTEINVIQSLHNVQIQLSRHFQVATRSSS